MSEMHVTTDAELRSAAVRYGPKVRWLRQGARLTGRELCRRVGITPSYLSDIETGRRLPAPEVSDRIADELNCDRDGLWRLALLERLSERDARILKGGFSGLEYRSGSGIIGSLRVEKQS